MAGTSRDAVQPRSPNDENKTFDEDAFREQGMGAETEFVPEPEPEPEPSLSEVNQEAHRFLTRGRREASSGHPVHVPFIDDPGRSEWDAPLTQEELNADINALNEPDDALNEPDAVESPEEAQARADKAGVPQPGRRAAAVAGAAWAAYPEHLRARVLAGGLLMFPSGNYVDEIAKAEAEGTITEAQGRAAVRSYHKWENSAWGAQANLHRMRREQKWIAQDAQGEQELYKSEAAAKQAAIHDEHLAQVEEERAEFEDFKERYQEDVSRQLEKQNAAIDELSKKEVDPNRWYNSKDTGGKVLAVLSLALGNLGASLSKSPNWAYGLIKSQIDADIRSQVYTLRHQTGAVKARATLVSQLNQRFNNIGQSVKVARLMMLDGVMAKTQSLASNLRSDVQQRNFKLITDLQKKDRDILRGELTNEAAKLAAARAAQRARAAAAHRRRLAMMGMPMKAGKAYQTAMDHSQGGKQGKLLGLRGEQGLKLRTEEKALAQLVMARRGIDEIRSRYKGKLAELLMNSQDAALMHQYSKNLVNAGRLLSGSGAQFTRDEMTLIKEGYGLDRFEKGIGGRTQEVFRQFIEGRQKRGGKPGELFQPFDNIVDEGIRLHNAKWNFVRFQPGSSGARRVLTKNGYEATRGFTPGGQELGYRWAPTNMTPVAHKDLRGGSTPPASGMDRVLAVGRAVQDYAGPKFVDHIIDAHDWYKKMYPDR